MQKKLKKAKKKPAVRPLGEITSDMEPLLQEMVFNHGLQMGEVLALVHGYLEIHCPACIEVYEDGTGSPTYYYGPAQERPI